MMSSQALLIAQDEMARARNVVPTMSAEGGIVSGSEWTWDA